jgi:hypothetical protein
VVDRFGCVQEGQDKKGSREMGKERIDEMGWVGKARPMKRKTRSFWTYVSRR